jgi:sarcosine oxidase subunit beta
LTVAPPSPDVIVIGGGIHGTSAALHLAMAGRNVTVLEKDYCGRHASGVNAGGVRTLARAEAEVPLSLASLDMWYAIRDLVDDDCGFESHGQIQLAETGADMETLSSRVDHLRAGGYHHEEIVDRQELASLLPAVSDQCVGGVIARRDGAAVPYRTVLAFQRRAKTLGVIFREGEAAVHVRRVGGDWEVTTSRVERLTAPVIVNCAGAWAGDIAQQVGDKAPVDVIAPMMMVTLPVPWMMDPVVIGSSRQLSLKQLANRTVLIGGGQSGTAVPHENRTELDFGKLCRSSRTVSELFPVLSGVTIVRAWAGLEARTPDGIPVISAGGAEGIFHAFGFSAHGFQLGPIVGRIISDLVVRETTDMPIAPFQIDRFSHLDA